MALQVVLAIQLSSVPVDRTRAAEMSQLALGERIREPDREVAARAELRRRFFEQRFKKLVDTVAAFAQEYNEGNGQVWSSAEAEKLRKAMSE
jgi:hypothetical protein